jgi:hypothetical protein
MDLQSILTDFLSYLYENNIDIRDEKNDWQVITKDFIEKNFMKESGYTHIPKKVREYLNGRIQYFGHKGIEKEHGFVSNAIPLRK